MNLVAICFKGDLTWKSVKKLKMGSMIILAIKNNLMIPNNVIMRGKCIWKRHLSVLYSKKRAHMM